MTSKVFAGGDVNFDMGRFGIGFVASPRHWPGMRWKIPQPLGCLAGKG